jgi:hypothetical protein
MQMLVAGSLAVAAAAARVRAAPMHVCELCFAGQSHTRAALRWCGAAAASSLAGQRTGWAGWEWGRRSEAGQVDG